MKVTVKGNTESTIFFEVRAGEVFEYDGQYYIKTDEENATNLNSGIVGYFDERDTCTIVNAEVIINFEEVSWLPRHFVPGRAL